MYRELFYIQNYKLLDTIFFKNLLEVTKVRQNAQQVIISIKNIFLSDSYKLVQL